MAVDDVADHAVTAAVVHDVAVVIVVGVIVVDAAGVCYWCYDSTVVVAVVFTMSYISYSSPKYACSTGKHTSHVCFGCTSGHGCELASFH